MEKTSASDKLTEDGKRISIFCEKNPAMIFNAPPQLHEEFEKKGGNKKPSPFIDALFENCLVNEFIQKVNIGDMLLILTSTKDNWITVLAKVDYLYMDNEFPPNWRIDFKRTKTYQENFGKHTNLWSGHIAAITTVRKLKKQMCWSKNALEIFFQKAQRYAVAPGELHKRQPKLILAKTSHPVHEVHEGSLKENDVYYLRGISAENLMIGSTPLQKGMLLTEGAVEFIKRQKNFDNISIEIHFGI